MKYFKSLIIAVAAASFAFHFEPAAVSGANLTPEMEAKMKQLAECRGVQNMKAAPDGSLLSLVIVAHTDINGNDGAALDLARRQTLDKARQSFSQFLNHNIICKKDTDETTKVISENGNESGSATGISSTDIEEYSKAAVIGLRPLYRQVKDGVYTVIYGWSKKECLGLRNITMTISPKVRQKYVIVRQEEVKAEETEETCADLAVKDAILNPAIRKAFLKNPMLFDGGYYLYRPSANCCVLIGVGRGTIKNGDIEKARLAAEKKAEQELVSMLNPVLVECKKKSNQTYLENDENAVALESSKECYKSLLKTYYAGVETAGYWFAENNTVLFCVRVTEVGNINPQKKASNWLDRCNQLEWKDENEQWRSILQENPWLAMGGSSVVTGPDGQLYLVVITSCKNSIPYTKALTMLRMRAEKYVMAFFVGSKITDTVRSISEYNAVNDKAEAADWRKQRAVFSSFAKINNMDPIAMWTYPDYNIRCACYVYPFKK